MSHITGLIRRIASGLGLELSRRSSSFHASFASALGRRQVEAVVDIGANDGEFARLVRANGFRGDIHSFEPLPAAFARLQQSARHDPRWHVHGVALSDCDGTAAMFESANSVSSSLLQPLDVDAHVAEGVRVIRRPEVAVRRLDSMAALGEITADWHRSLLKIDVQGSEDRVLNGCGALIRQVPLVLVEVSFQPLYDGSAGWIELMRFLEKSGFAAIDLQRGFRDERNARLLQADVLLERIAGAA